MEVVIRPVARGRYEAVRTDAVSCTYDMNGFTLMSAVLSQLGLDREHFRKCARMHEGEKFRVISHGDEKPFVITTNLSDFEHISIYELGSDEIAVNSYDIVLMEWFNLGDEVYFAHPAAQGFADAMLTPQAQGIFARYGFGSP